MMYIYIFGSKSGHKIKKIMLTRCDWKVLWKWEKQSSNCLISCFRDHWPTIKQNIRSSEQILLFEVFYFSIASWIKPST